LTRIDRNTYWLVCAAVCVCPNCLWSNPISTQHEHNFSLFISCLTNCQRRNFILLHSINILCKDRLVCIWL